MAQVVGSPVTRATRSLRPPAERGRGDRLLSRTARLGVFATAMAALATLALVALLPLTGPDELHGRVATALFVTGMAGLAIVGGLLASQRPHATIAWLLLGTGLLGVLARADVGLAVAAADANWPGARIVGWTTNWSWVPAQVLGMVLLLRFPTGRLPGRRWRFVEWCVLAWGAMTTLVTALVPGALGVEALAPATNPVGVESLARPLDAVLGAVFAMLPVLVVLVVAAPLVRWRGATPDERRQLTWVAGAAVLIAVTAPLAVVSDLGEVLEGFAFLVLPGAIAVAVLRHRLWDVDLRRRLARVRAVREEERARLQRELHDSLGPVLGSISMRAEAARNLLAADSDRERLDGLLASIGSDTEDAMVEVRRLVEELEPTLLADSDLVTAVRQHLTSYGEAVRLELHAPEELPELSPKTELVAFRVVAEAVRNALRHSAGSLCRVSLEAEAGTLIVEVADDGVGLRGAPSGVGRRAMARRVAEVGGRYELSEPATGGVTVRAVLPGSPR